MEMKKNYFNSPIILFRYYNKTLLVMYAAGSHSCIDPRVFIFISLLPTLVFFSNFSKFELLFLKILSLSRMCFFCYLFFNEFHRYGGKSPGSFLLVIHWLTTWLPRLRAMFRPLHHFTPSVNLMLRYCIQILEAEAFVEVLTNHTKVIVQIR